MRIRTDYFSLLLRDIFKVPDQPPVLEAPDVIVPVYNLAPPDLLFEHVLGINGPPGGAMVGIVKPSVVSWSGSHAAAANTTILSGIKPNSGFRLRWTFCPSSANNVQVIIRTVSGGVTRIIGYSFYIAGQYGDNMHETPWLRYPAACDVQFEVAGAAGSGYSSVLFEILPD